MGRPDTIMRTPKVVGPESNLGQFKIRRFRPPLAHRQQRPRPAHATVLRGPSRAATEDRVINRRYVLTAMYQMMYTASVKTTQPVQNKPLSASLLIGSSFPFREGSYTPRPPPSPSRRPGWGLAAG